MKNLLKSVVVAILALLPLAGCDKNTDNVAPTVNITLIEVGSDSATISIQARNADEYAYMLYDGDVISVDEVFKRGDIVEELNSGIKITNREPETTYYVIAAARNSVGEALSEAVKFTTEKGSDNGGNNDNNDDNNNTELPDIDGVENITIVKTQDGRWYEPYNY